MNPYHHALSSQRSYGGAIINYLPIRNWFDATKAALAHFTHRALHHHHQGISETVQLFGPSFSNADHAVVSVEAIGLQHLAEDMSIIPSAADWLKHLDPTGFPEYTPSAAELATHAARRFDTTADTLLPLHSWFLATASWFDDPRHLMMRHQSFGIFEAEHRFGITLGNTRNPIPTRIVAEWHVRTILGRIPPAADLLRRIKGQPWMAAAQKARHLGFV